MLLQKKKKKKNEEKGGLPFDLTQFSHLTAK